CHVRPPRRARVSLGCARVQFSTLFHQLPLPYTLLLSSPTRRSSDLPAPLPLPVFETILPVAKQLSTTPPSKIIPAIPPTLLLPRSEEHTSELQSRENLICRLLLEKKKRISLTLLA